MVFTNGSGSQILDNSTSQPPWSTLDSRYCYIEGRLFDCMRITVLLFLGIITGVICLLRVLQYHCYCAKNYHQYIIYYIALLICALSVVHWGYVWTPILDLVGTYLIVLQMLVISWFFCSWAFRILQKEKIFNFVLLPLLVCWSVYFTACLIWASIMSSEVSQECTEPQWLLFSSSLLLLVQCFLASVIYITKKLSDIRTMKTNRFSQRVQLWGLLVMYEFVSIAAFAYDIYLLLTRSVDGDCGIDFNDNRIGVGVTIMYIIHKVVKYIFPQLAICMVFAPLKARPVNYQQELEETDTLSWADKPNYKSTFYDSSVAPLLPSNSNPNSSIVPQSLNNSQPILPRSTSDSPANSNSPWIIPTQSWKTLLV